MTRRSFNKTLYNNVYSQLKPPKIKTPLQQTTQWALSGLSVYRFVFTTKVAFGVALLVCASLLFQPVAFAYAEEPVTDPTVVEETTDTPDSETAVETEPVGSDQKADLQPEIPENTPQNSNVEDNPDTTTPASAPVTTDTEEEQTAEVPAAATTTVGIASTTANATDESTADVVTVETATTSTQALTATTTATQTATSPSPSNATATTSTSSATNIVELNGSTTDTVTISSGASTASTSPESMNSSGAPDVEVGTSSATSTTPMTNDVSTTQTDNAFAFNKNECTEVEDGSFYCQKISSETMAENDLFAAPDATGDMEIYVMQNGEQIQVTDNAIDDASPYYDARSKSIVWHRLVNDRYQIISYDVETQAETQLTDTSVNNMEPTKNGDYVVWQRWVQNNWEIILREGETETQITDSIEHDIAPHIRGDLIIWNVRSSDGSQSLMTYDISTESFNEIRDTDGVSVTNPRMLVMYEAQHQNGDTVMKGFDLVTGEIIPIERIPRDIPSDIPSPEATGEVRALPTNPQTEEELGSDSDLDTDEPSDKVVQHHEDDLVLTATTTATSTPTTETIDFDLDLRPSDEQIATTTNGTVIDQAAIPDVVVPEYTQPDSSEQASSTQHN